MASGGTYVSLALSLVPQINDFTNGAALQVSNADGTPVKDALEALSNIDGVTVTLTPAFSFDGGTSLGTLELQYEITFTGECVRGDIPAAALEVFACTMSATAGITVMCR